MTIGPEHNLVIKRLSRLDPLLASAACHMQCQGPVTIAPNHEPEPDGAVIKGTPEDFAHANPGPKDVCAVLEVGDSSLPQERTTKLRIYAEAGIPQYIIVNLAEHQLEAYEQPQRNKGRYVQSNTLKAGQTLKLCVGSQKHLDIPVASILAQ